jgi:hypothetical protein
MSAANVLGTAGYETVPVKRPVIGHEARGNKSKKNRQPPIYRKRVAGDRTSRTTIT